MLSGRNINLANVGKVLRTSASDRRKPDGREFVVDSLMDWKPAKSMLKWRKWSSFDDLKIIRAELFLIF